MRIRKCTAPGPLLPLCLRTIKKMWKLLLLAVFLLLLCSFCNHPKMQTAALNAFDYSYSNLVTRDEYDDAPDDRAVSFANRATTPLHRESPPPRAAPRTLPTKTARRRVTPFVAKSVAAKYKWRCAICGELLTPDFEVDHRVSLQNGGSNDLENLQPLHKRGHLTKSSLEQRARGGH